MSSARRKLDVRVERWPLRQPFAITGHVWTEAAFLVVELAEAGHRGRGEAAGVYYRGETAEGLARQVESARAALEAGAGRDALPALLGPGGASNAVDAALWELEAAQAGKSVAALAGLPEPRPLVTTFTVGIDSPKRMGEAARAYAGAKAVKVKLDGAPADADRLRAVRAAQPDAWLAVDANQGWSPALLERQLPLLEQLGVRLVEQPLPVGADAVLSEFRYPIPLAADESFQTHWDLPGLQGRYQVVNIKLDKCGGLTAGLELARMARARGFSVMVGNMLGTTLAMAPHWLVGQLCDVVDLDGPLFLARDRQPAASYQDGQVDIPAAAWGGVP